MPHSKAANKRHQQDHRDRGKARRLIAVEINTLFQAAVIPDTVEIVPASGPDRVKINVEYDKAGYEAFEAKCAESKIDPVEMAHEMIHFHYLRAAMTRARRRALSN